MGHTWRCDLDTVCWTSSALFWGKRRDFHGHGMSVMGTAAQSRRGCCAQGSHPAHKKCPHAGWRQLRQNKFSLLGKLVKTESGNNSKSRWDRDGLGYKTAELRSKEDGPMSLEAAQGTRLGPELCWVTAKQSSVSPWGMTRTEFQFYSQCVAWKCALSGYFLLFLNQKPYYLPQPNTSLFPAASKIHKAMCLKHL